MYRTIKSAVRKVTPNPMLELYWRFLRWRKHKQNSSRNVKEIFSSIYSKNEWGGTRGEFCSGNGSTDERVVSLYVSMVARFAQSEGFMEKKFVDLGCGDFRVGQLLVPLCEDYIGVDVVENLVLRNQAEFGNQSVRFTCLDIIEDNLPAGDVCFIRQVLQHLSNVQIHKILLKLNKYKWVFVTEHHPLDLDLRIPNVEKTPGADIRLVENSGVYISSPPFSVPPALVEIVLEVPVFEGGKSSLIRTYMFKPLRLE
jgi:hypothetical protein